MTELCYSICIVMGAYYMYDFMGVLFVLSICFFAMFKFQSAIKKEKDELSKENEYLKNQLHVNEIEMAVLNERIKSFMEVEEQVALLNRELIDKHNENIELHIKLSLEEQKAFSLKRLEA